VNARPIKKEACPERARFCDYGVEILLAGLKRKL